MTSAPNSCCTRSEPVGVVVVTQMRPTPCRAIRLRISGTAASVSPTDTACTQTAIGAAGRTTKPRRSPQRCRYAGKARLRHSRDRKSAVQGKSVSGRVKLGGRRYTKKKQIQKKLKNENDKIKVDTKQPQLN